MSCTSIVSSDVKFPSWFYLGSSLPLTYIFPYFNFIHYISTSACVWQEVGTESGNTLLGLHLFLGNLHSPSHFPAYSYPEWWRAKDYGAVFGHFLEALKIGVCTFLGYVDMYYPLSLAKILTSYCVTCRWHTKSHPLSPKLGHPVLPSIKATQTQHVGWSWQGNQMPTGKSTLELATSDLNRDVFHAIGGWEEKGTSEQHSHQGAWGGCGVKGVFCFVCSENYQSVYVCSWKQLNRERQTDD